MTFPTYVSLFGLRVHPHLLFDLLAYSGGFQLYRWTVRRDRRRAPAGVESPTLEQRLWVVAGAVLGAAIGAKLLAWAEDPQVYGPALLSDPRAWAGGKTIVGGLLGGWAGVEVAKWRVGLTRSTGDAMVPALAVGTAVGRVGCFLTGLDDHTYGLATRLPWGVDFGDGVRRHPTQLYEIAFVLLLGAALWVHARRPRPDGEAFRLYLAGYLAWRLAVEFIKPREFLYGPLTAIQWASLAGAVVALCSAGRRRSSACSTPRDVSATIAGPDPAP